MQGAIVPIPKDILPTVEAIIFKRRIVELQINVIQGFEDSYLAGFFG